MSPKVLCAKGLVFKALLRYGRNFKGEATGPKARIDQFWTRTSKTVN